ncbi:MAG: leucine-rich repeat protein [Ruminococcus flavefaciens]
MKTKKALSFILSAGMFISGMTCAVPSAVSAEEEQTVSYSQQEMRQFIRIGPMFFRCDLEHAVLVNFDKTYEGEVEIPAYVQGVPVTALGERCLAFADGITKLTIPETVRTIGNAALYDLYNIKELIIPASVETISGNAMYGMSGLEKVTFRCPYPYIIGENINFMCYSGCEGPHVPYDMKICGYKGSDVEKIAKELFCDFCDETTEEGSDVIAADGTWKDGFCFEIDSEKNEAKLIGCDIVKANKSGVIPSEVEGVPVTEIAEYALTGAHFQKIVIPDTVRYIGDCGLGNYMYGYPEIVIPESVEYVGRDFIVATYSSMETITFMSPDTKIDSCNFRVFDFDPTGGTYFWGPDTFGTECTIRGFEGSEAEKAAKEHGLKFEALTVEERVYGDANVDGDVNMADSVLIMQSVSSPDSYSLTENGKKNADVTGGGDGVTNKDALAIQSYMLGLTVSLPE